MTPFFLLWFALAPAGLQPAWEDLTLSIEKDRSSSSDTITLCRVRVVNNGRRVWSGSALRFEARALDGATAVARETGRFGLSLAPHESLETLIAFVGVYERFEIRPLSGSDRTDSGRRGPPRRGRGRRGRKSR